ncbi:MAG TPA: CHRD domain-containing protein [Gaiellaceae bacterium]|nr:CHRD domain-containing protein [Gaiellaceae bacterium]
MTSIRGGGVMAKALCAMMALALVLVGLALAAPERDTYNLTANLKARFEVPKPKGVPTGATGLFTGKAIELDNDRGRLTWRLTFSKLSGRAAAAHIHSGRVGKAGGVMVALCGQCRNGQRGSVTISHAQIRTIRTGRTYVNIHTAKNGAGEIRGQVKASEAGSGSSSDPTPPPTTSDPPTYP